MFIHPQGFHYSWLAIPTQWSVTIQLGTEMKKVRKYSYLHLLLHFWQLPLQSSFLLLGKTCFHRDYFVCYLYKFSCTNYFNEQGPSLIEKRVLDWLCSICKEWQNPLNYGYTLISLPNCSPVSSAYLTVQIHPMASPFQMLCSVTSAESAPVSFPNFNKNLLAYCPLSQFREHTSQTQTIEKFGQF